MSDISSITVDLNGKTISDYLSLLKEKGVIIIPNFINETDIKKLNEEFNLIINEGISTGVDKIDYSSGKGFVIRKGQVIWDRLPITKKVFYSEDFENISVKYLESQVDLNKDIYVVKDVVGSKHHANDLHFDVAPTFKFFIYLTDTTKENGAFACVPGSHHKSAEIRQKLGDKISYENRELSRMLPATENDVISVEGKAGSLIIFDTDVFHRAGTVSIGERRVMRGHTRVKLENIFPKKTSWFSKLKSKLSGK